MLSIIFILAAILAVSLAVNFTPDPAHQKYMWEQFKLQFNKRYDTDAIDATRFGHFLNNLKITDQRNAEETGTAIHGITKFSDLSQEEFEATMLRSDPSLRDPERPVADVSKLNTSVQGLVDWTGTFTTPVKDQGYCGSCWAFSATEQIETDAMRTLGISYILSAAQITQCDSTSFGCNGGWTERAYSYVTRAGGVELDSDYPYTSTMYYGTTGKCSSQSTSFKIGVTGYTTIKGEANMATFVQNTGPLSVCLDASTFNSYTGGIMATCGTSVNHCVQAVGVDTASYWKVRNSWGTAWGESGFIRLAYGKNTCAITNDPTYTSVFKV